ncbi:NnrS family protein [Rhodopseudomonas pseudopalustris]|uniref:Uncharacterized protein involved in response to NO n=1 Tax=Rhodopseudomonas pseudopalustris TaxID=1513892 RepID=A0A1H8PHS9_9BRAD|nr:NnrS family protein [Rhodopseudomonas pseudopalustris]SEO41376.1 uncharacterized protein involved in response to NO [Rhodopseudomonas pseudopalustris]
MAMQHFWTGPALFSYGFRPFFLFGALHAALMVGLWVPWYLGFIHLPSAFPPVVWHSHELLFGYVPAIMAGFLLTAVPNWTGRPPIVGWPLIGLFALWLLGRAGVALSNLSPPAVVATFSLAFLLALFAVLAREIVAAKNWRNLKLLAGIGVLTLAQALFHYEIWRYGRATYGDHLALAAALTMIIIVGGRIVPSFTGNWLKQENPGALPASPGPFDRVAAIVGIAGLLAWGGAPSIPAAHTAVAGLLLIAGLLQGIRQLRWRPERTLAEPLVAVLHLGYAFLPLGFLLAAYALWTAEKSAATAATHAWTVGAIGLMTLAVMTRAIRGHTGHPLTAPFGTIVIYALMATAAATRITAALLPETAFVVLSLSGAAWVGAFVLFASLYGPMLLRRPAMQR